MSDILTEIDTAVEGRCPCGAEPQPGSAYCGDDCRPTHRGPDTDAPWLGGPHAARWRPDLVTAFDDTGLTLLDCTHRDDTGLDYCVYTRTESDVAFLRVDDGHRFVGIEVPWAELEASGPSEPFRRLERELTDQRRLDLQQPAHTERTPRAIQIPTGYWLRDNEALRQRLCEWLEANGIDHETVPMDADIWVVDGWINYEAFQPHGPGPLREACLAPMVQPWVDETHHMDPAALDRIRQPQLREGDRITIHWSNAGTDESEVTEARVAEVRPDGTAVTEPVDRDGTASFVAPGRDAWEDLRAAWRMLEGHNPAVRFDAGSGVVEAVRNQVPQNRAMDLPMGGLLGIPIVADPAMLPGSWRLEYADGQRLESHVCRWEVSFETGWYRCGLYWPDGHRCESRTGYPATVLRTQWLVGPRSVES